MWADLASFGCSSLLRTRSFSPTTRKSLITPIALPRFMACPGGRPTTFKVLRWPFSPLERLRASHCSLAGLSATLFGEAKSSRWPSSFFVRSPCSLLSGVYARPPLGRHFAAEPPTSSLPEFFVRLGHVEHVANVFAFAMIPVAFRGVLVFLEERNPWGAIQCAVASALLVLAYAKIAVLVLPLLAAFALWVWIARAQFTPPSRQILLLLCLGIFFVLACLPNLPSLRETSFVAKFDFGPFEAWQRGYSCRINHLRGLTGKVS